MNEVFNFLFKQHIQNPTLLCGLIYALVLLVYGWRSRIELALALYLPFLYYVGDVIAATITGFGWATTNLWLYNLLILVEIPITLYIFYQWTTINKYRHFIILGIAVFVLLHSLNLIFLQGIASLATYTIAMGQVLQAAVAFWYLNIQIQRLDGNPLRSYDVWFTAVTFVTFAGSIPILAMFNYFNYTNTVLADRIYVLNDISYCSWYIFLLIGLLWTKRQRR